MTTAIALWLLIGGGAVAYAGWATLAIAHGADAWRYAAGAVAIYPFAVCVITAFWFALAWAFRAPRPARAHLGVAACVRLFWNEYCAVVRFPRMALYKWLIREPRPAPAAAPVLLLHGVLCNAGVWTAFRQHLAARGIAPLYTLSYGPPLASIEVFAAQLAKKIDYIRRVTGASRVTIVSHSMGALVARAYLRRHGGQSVSALIALGAPHHGSVHAWLFPGTCLRQLRPGNGWLAALNEAENVEPDLPSVSIWSWHDSMVAPQTSCRLRGARNVEVIGVGHNALLNDRHVRELVVAELERIGRDARPLQRVRESVA